MAVMPLLRLAVARPAPERVGLRSQPEMYWSDRFNDILRATGETWDVAVLHPPEFRIDPHEMRAAANIKIECYDRTVRVRVDCDHTLPFEHEARVQISEEMAWLEAPRETE